MRQLTEQEFEVFKVELKKFNELQDRTYDVELNKFKAGFIAGLSHQDKRIEALEAFIAGKITRAQLDEVTK